VSCGNNCAGCKCSTNNTVEILDKISVADHVKSYTEDVIKRNLDIGFIDSVNKILVAGAVPYEEAFDFWTAQHEGLSNKTVLDYLAIHPDEGAAAILDLAYQLASGVIATRDNQFYI
jgi:hypothetical protein